MAVISTEEAIAAIERGEHLDATRGLRNPDADEGLIYLLRLGKIRAGYTKDGKLAFQAILG